MPVPHGEQALAFTTELNSPAEHAWQPFTLRLRVPAWQSLQPDRSAFTVVPYPHVVHDADPDAE